MLRFLFVFLLSLLLLSACSPPTVEWCGACYAVATKRTTLSPRQYQDHCEKLGESDCSYCKEKGKSEPDWLEKGECAAVAGQIKK